MTCPRDPPTDGYLLGPRCLGSKWVVMSAGAIPHRETPWLNPSDPIDIDSVTFKAITFHRPPWSPHHLLWADSWLATNYWQEEGSRSLCVRVLGFLLLRHTQSRTPSVQKNNSCVWMRRCPRHYAWCDVISVDWKCQRLQTAAPHYGGRFIKTRGGTRFKLLIKLITESDLLIAIIWILIKLYINKFSDIFNTKCLFLLQNYWIDQIDKCTTACYGHCRFFKNVLKE